MFPSFQQLLPTLQPAIKTSQENRKKAKKKIFRNFIIGFVLWVSVILSWILFQSRDVTGTILFIVFLASAVLIGLSLRAVKVFRLSYSKILVANLVKQLFANIEPNEEDENHEYRVSYMPGRKISSSKIKESNLISSFTLYNGEDYTVGKLGLTTFEFSEILLQKEEYYTDRNGRRQKRVKKVFDGIIFIADFHKHFSGETYLIRKRFFGSDKWRLVFDGSFEIELEDMEFNETFRTMTTNDIEARYILSSNLMKKIMEFNKRAKGNVQIAFRNSKMFITKETSKNHFEGKFFRNNDEEVLEEIYNDFRLYFDIIEEFTLNRRIWSKV